MKKIAILTFIFVFFGTTSVFALQNINNSDNPELLQKLKAQRNLIYTHLNLSEEQEKLIYEKDEIYYEELKPKIIKVSAKIRQIKDLAALPVIMKDDIESVKKDFDKLNIDISKIKKRYEKNFIKVLNSEQKAIYKVEKQLANEQLKQELRNSLK